jgi:hypothetical protein
MNAEGRERPEVSWLSRQQGEGHATLRCVCCGYPVSYLLMGCKAPCRNCWFLYPAGDCSD